MFAKSYSRKALLPILFVAAMALAACGGTPTPAPTIEPGGEKPTAAAAATESSGGATGTGLCSNDFFPVVVGASWTYSSEGSLGPTTWTSTITDVSESGFTMTNQYDELTATQQWSCTAEGLAALEYGGGPEATLTASGVQGTFETTDTSGVSFPTHIAAGDTWSQSFTIHGDMQLSADQSGTADGTVTQSFNAVGLETVETAAGSFEGMRVDAAINFDLQITVQGISVPITFASTMSNWWVQGVGWVKSDSTTTIEGSEPFASSTQLTSFTIP
jgi:hypothetical protein